MNESARSTIARKNLDPAHLAAWRALLTVHAAVVGQIERELAADGLIPLTWYDVLFALSEAQGHKLRLSELAEQVLLSRSGLTRMVNRLEAAGLLRREACATDRRGAYAVLTADGYQSLRRTWPAYARGIVTHFADQVTEEEARIITSTLDRVADRARIE